MVVTELMMRHWPLFGLRVRTPRLELRYPTDEDIAEIAERSVTEEVHDPSTMPFTVEWTDVAPPLQQRFSMQHHWSNRATWTPQKWICPLLTTVDGRIIGMQGAGAENFAITRTANTGSYLLRPFHRQGSGTEMRAAILHLLFDGLGAEYAETGAWSDNAASLGVTRALGYEPQGTKRLVSRGVARDQLTFRLPRATWEARRRDDIAIEGLAPCLALFGVIPDAPASTDAVTDGS